MGVAAVRIAHQGLWGHMTALRGTQIVPVPLADVTGKLSWLIHNFLPTWPRSFRVRSPAAYSRHSEFRTRVMLRPYSVPRSVRPVADMTSSLASTSRKSQGETSVV